MNKKTPCLVGLFSSRSNIFHTKRFCSADTLSEKKSLLALRLTRIEKGFEQVKAMEQIAPPFGLCNLSEPIF